MSSESFALWLSGSNLIYVGFSLFILYNVVSAIYLAYVSPLAKFPGPKSWAISRLPVSWYAINGVQWQAVEKLHSKYGAVVRIGPTELSTTSSTSWTDLYTSRPIMPKDPYSQTPPLNGAHSLFTASGGTHKRIRAALVGAFSDKALRDQASIIESYADSLVARLRREMTKVGEEGVIDIERYFGYATLDIIADLTFGESFDGLAGSNEHSWIQGFFFHAKFGNVRNLLSRFAPLDRLFGVVFLSLTRRHRLRNWKIVTEKIRRRLALGDLSGARSDFITPVIGKVNESGIKGITMAELTTNGLGVVIAGCQLSTVALATATYLLLRSSDTLRELVKEIRYDAGFNYSEDITVQSTQRLPYLAAVINETLRIHHPTPIALPRVVPPGGRVIDGDYIPGGTVIGVNLQNIQNSPDNWDAPREFHPERFLPADNPRYDTRFERDAKAAFMPFSTGPRNCLGSQVFLAEARVILAKVLFALDMEAAHHDDTTWMDQKAFLVFEPKALMVKLKNRSYS